MNTYAFLKTGKRSIKPLTVGLAILVIYFGGIGIAKAAGIYDVLPEPITAETVITDVDTLKGYMTLSEISRVLGIPLDDVYRKMEIPENIPSSIPAKELSGMIPGFDFHEAREALKE